MNRKKQFHLQREDKRAFKRQMEGGLKETLEAYIRADLKGLRGMDSRVWRCHYFVILFSGRDAACHFRVLYADKMILAV